MDLIPIGEAARRLGVRTSTLRYYDERGLVRPAKRANGKRWYGLPELRRLALLQLAQKLGISLDTVAAVLDRDGPDWRAAVAGQIAELDALIAKAQGARDFLVHAQRCPAEHPVPDCPHLTGTLDRLVDGFGGSVEELRSRWPAEDSH